MPHEIQFDAAGHLYIVERDNHVVRKVDARTGRHLDAGRHRHGRVLRRRRARRPGAAAAAAQHRVRAGRTRLLICDVGNHRIRRVDLATGHDRDRRRDRRARCRHRTARRSRARRSTVRGRWRSIADGTIYLALREGQRHLPHRAAATAHAPPRRGHGRAGLLGRRRARLALARFAGPKGLALRGGPLFVADTENHVIRRIDLDERRHHHGARHRQRGDGPGRRPAPVPARAAARLSLAADGTLYVGDSEAHRIRVLRS